METRRLNGYELLSDLGFELRRSKGVGFFLDTAALRYYRELTPMFFLDEFVGSSMKLVTTLMGERFVMVSGIASSGRLQTCDPELWIDGFEAGWWKMQAYGAHEIFGIEVFMRNQIPPASIAGELGARQAVRPMTLRCGIIAVWTKNFLAERRRKDAARR
jgi:hypothetical protein